MIDVGRASDVRVRWSRHECGRCKGWAAVPASEPRRPRRRVSTVAFVQLRSAKKSGLEQRVHHLACVDAACEFERAASLFGLDRRHVAVASGDTSAVNAEGGKRVPKEQSDQPGARDDAEGGTFESHEDPAVLNERQHRTRTRVRNRNRNRNRDPQEFDS